MCQGCQWCQQLHMKIFVIVIIPTDWAATTLNPLKVQINNIEHDTHVMPTDKNHPLNTLADHTPHGALAHPIDPEQDKVCHHITKTAQDQPRTYRWSLSISDLLILLEKKSLSVTHSIQNSKSKDEIVACCDRIPETDWLYSLVCLCQAARGAGYFYTFVPSLQCISCTLTV